MHTFAYYWLLPLLAAMVIYVYIILHDVSTFIRALFPAKRTSWLYNIYATLDRHLSIMSSVQKLANTIESGIRSLDTRTARERKQTKINIFKHSRVNRKPRNKVNLCRLACIVHVVVCATDVTTHPQTRKVIFDTDSIPIRVDNCAPLPFLPAVMAATSASRSSTQCLARREVW
jgi:hypothetical protein